MFATRWGSVLCSTENMANGHTHTDYIFSHVQNVCQPVWMCDVYHRHLMVVLRATLHTNATKMCVVWYGAGVMCACALWLHVLLKAGKIFVAAHKAPM